MATKLTLEAPWEKVNEKIKDNNIYLADDDLIYTPGKEDELLGSLAKK